MKPTIVRLASGICAGAVMMVFAAAQSNAQAYKAPKTPWGDPDIQGNYTNLTEAGTPLEKPKEFEGKQLSDVSADELKTIKRQAAERTINNFLGPTEAPDNWWQVAYRNIEHGAQAWMVIDPPDGRIPPTTAEAKTRAAALAAAMSLPSSAQAAEGEVLVEFHFQPVPDVQIAIWLEDADGNFVKDVLVTQATGTLGIGNRPGRDDFLSSWRFPYGPRKGVLPIWGHARGKSYPELVFHDDNPDDWDSLGWHENSSSPERASISSTPSTDSLPADQRPPAGTYE